jgi:hypothetical protein
MKLELGLTLLDRHVDSGLRGARRGLSDRCHGRKWPQGADSVFRWSLPTVPDDFDVLPNPVPVPAKALVLPGQILLSDSNPGHIGGADRCAGAAYDRSAAHARSLRQLQRIRSVTGVARMISVRHNLRRGALPARPQVGGCFHLTGSFS